MESFLAPDQWLTQAVWGDGAETNERGHQQVHVVVDNEKSSKHLLRFKQFYDVTQV